MHNTDLLNQCNKNKATGFAKFKSLLKCFIFVQAQRPHLAPSLPLPLVNTAPTQNGLASLPKKI